MHRYQDHESLNKFIETALDYGNVDNLEHWYDLFYDLKSSLIPVPNLLNTDLFEETNQAYVKSLAELIKVGNDNVYE